MAADGRVSSRRLMQKMKNLSKVKLVDASFIWTEPHSKRIKMKVRNLTLWYLLTSNLIKHDDASCIVSATTHFLSLLFMPISLRRSLSVFSHQVTIQKQVQAGAVLQQTFVAEFVVEDHHCDSCTRAAANPDQWTAVVQVKQWCCENCFM